MSVCPSEIWESPVKNTASFFMCTTKPTQQLIIHYQNKNKENKWIRQTFKILPFHVVTFDLLYLQSEGAQAEGLAGRHSRAETVQHLTRRHHPPLWRRPGTLPSKSALEKVPER